MTDNFKIKNDPTSEVEVFFKPTSKKWTFELYRNEKGKEVYKIELKRLKKSALFLSINEVQLISHSNVLSDYTTLWKVFELVLAENHIKADLVQLNGYYQYTNDISYNFVKSSDEIKESIWKLLELILIDPTIGQIKHINQFAMNYNITRDELIKHFFDLRKIGFEIRNSNTNPEISEDEYLIPYKFPTLTPLSVQLKKTL